MKYRWWYVDVTSGDHTAVVIFMVGSVFSARYAARPDADPTQHAAVNFALYERSVRKLWVLSEHARADDDGTTLRIGGSTLRREPGRVSIQLAERTLFGKRVEAKLELDPLGPSVEPQTLVEGLGHLWHPIAPRAHAKVTMPGLTFEGRAYHDANWGPVPLGTDLRGWDWVRTHDHKRTAITFRLWHDAPALSVNVTQAGAEAQRIEAPRAERRESAWGLSIPQDIGAHLLESSPFYARAETRFLGDGHTLGEAADFRRFRSPWIRWMSRLRTRVEKAA